MADNTRSKHLEIVQRQDAQDERIHAMREDLTQLTEIVWTLVTNSTAQVAHCDHNLHHERVNNEFRRDIHRGIKLDFPYCDGKNPVAWVFKANHYFEYYQTSHAQKLLMASYHMEGDALNWYQDVA